MSSRRTSWAAGRVVGLLVALAFATEGCQSTPSSGGPAPPVTAARLSFQLPATWEAQPPSSSMRAFQARIPGSSGDAEFALFFFGEGQGGGVAENIQRWIDQIEFVPGASSTHREEFSTNGLTVFWVDFSGTLKPSPMTGGSNEPKPNTRVLGAVIEGPHGPWFMKAVGPEATLAAQRDAFVRLLESAKPE